MTEPLIQPNPMLATLRANDLRLRQTETRETPPIYLPWSQRVLNPFPLASSGGVWGEMPQPWPVNVLAFYCTVFVSTTNNGTNFWTIAVFGAPSNTAIASVTTAAIAANTFSRLSDLTITQPASTDTEFYILCTATLSPGSLILHPAVALLRTGN